MKYEFAPEFEKAMLLKEMRPAEELQEDLVNSKENAAEVRRLNAKKLKMDSLHYQVQEFVLINIRHWYACSQSCTDIQQ